MFQFTPFPSHVLCIHTWIHTNYRMWVPPFGNLRVIGYLLLTAAYRSLSRPSSAPSAKASALCSLLLDHLATWRSVARIFFTIVNSIVKSFSGFLGEIGIYP